MNTLNIAIVLGILIVIIVLLIIVISMLNKKKPVKSKNSHISTSDFIPMPDTYSLSLPPNVEKIGKNEIQGIVRKIFDSYKYFDYKNMDIEQLAKKEWHSWQISMMLNVFKHNEEFFISGQENIFHSSILNSNENNIKSLMRDILKKYINYVDPNSTKDELCKEYIWTNKDASIIFYFLANYKKYSN